MRSLLALTAAVGLLAGRALAANPVEGEWLVQSGEARVRIAPCPSRTEQLCGAIVWLREPLDAQGQPKRDVHNPDPGLRARPILGLQLIRDFRLAAGGRWDGGKIYDPKTGRTYDSKMRLAADGTLRLDGCVLMFCRTQTWRRPG